MSASYYDDRRTSTRDRRRSDDYYDDSTTYANTRDNQRSTTAIVKRRNSDDDYEEDRRDFSPGGGYYRETITRKSGTRPAGRARSYDDDRYYEDDRSYASSRRDSYYGRRKSGYDDRRRSTRYDSDYSSRSPSPKPKKERRKSMPEEALEAVGLGGLAATLMGKKNRSRSRSSSSGRRSSSRRRARSSSPQHKKEQLTQALKAAVIAGAVSAFRARNEEGGWGGDKGRRVLTAAVTAGGVDGFINRDKDPDKHKFRDTVGSALAGVATDRLVNGPSSRSRSRGPGGRRMSPDDRRRSRSRSRLGTIAAGIPILAAARKSISGRSTSRGRDRDRDRSLTPDSYDSRSPPPRKSSRRRSSVAGALSKVGLDSIADKVDPAGKRERSRSRSVGGRRRSSRARSRYSDEDDASYMEDGRRRGSSIYDPPNNFNGRGSSIYDNRDVGNPNSSSRSLNAQDGAMVPQRTNSIGPGGKVLSPPPPGYVYDTRPHQNGDPETDSDSDLGSSSDDDRLEKKGRKRMFLTGGLATVATIHAGHSIQQSVLKRHMRHQALKDGTISKEEAEKHKVRDRMQEAASVGLAALGVKGAYSEWKEMKERQSEFKERKEKNERHAMKREARRMKYEMVGMDGGHANSAPTLSDPFYAGDGHDNYGRHQYYRGSEGPFMTGANPPAQSPSPFQQGYAGGGAPRTETPQYYDENPYGGYAHQQGYPQQGYHDNHYANPAAYPPPPAPQPPPAQGGTGFPPPPGSQPPPQQGR